MSPLAIYSSNVRSWISLAMINEADLEFGSEVGLVWGEPDGGRGGVAQAPMATLASSV